MGNPVFSIIVPAYNVECVLHEAIESVLNQDFNSFELIIINDGSKDNTKKVADSYAAKDNRVRVLNQNNGGASSARNNGIDHANGKYIAFLDSDDRYKKEYLSTMYRELHKGAELSVCGFDLFKNGRKCSSICYFEGDSRQITIAEYLEQMLQYHDQAYWGANWNKVYSADIIKKNKIYFQEGISIGEDLYFNLCYLQYIKRVNLVVNSLYEYEAATVDSLSKQKRSAFDYCKQYALISECYVRLCLPHSSQIENFEKMMDRFVNLSIWDTAWTGFVGSHFSCSHIHQVRDDIREKFGDLYKDKGFVASKGKVAKFVWLTFNRMDTAAWIVLLMENSKRALMKIIRRNLQRG